MKKLKKLLTLLPLFALCSCAGGDRYVGKYSFQLGSSEGTHFGILLDLTKEPCDPADVEKGNKFKLSFDAADFIKANYDLGEVEGLINKGGEILNNISSSEITSESTSTEDSSSEIFDDFTINGCYTIGERLTNGEDQIHMSITVDEDIKEYIKSIISIFYPGELPPEFDFGSIPPEILEMILYASGSGRYVNIVIPVSAEDLLFQIYWYGYRIFFNETMLIPVVKDLSEENPWLVHHDVGSHPTEDDVEKIRKYEKSRGLLLNVYENFRDYHTLSMGLERNG